MDTNSRMQIADKAMKSFIARYFRDDEDGTGMITGEFYWPRAEIMEVVMDAWDKTKDPYYQELMGKCTADLSKSLEKTGRTIRLMMISCG